MGPGGVVEIDPQTDPDAEEEEQQQRGETEPARQAAVTAQIGGDLDAVAEAARAKELFVDSA